MKNTYILFITLSLMYINASIFAQPANDDCSNAIDLSSSLGQGGNNLVNAGTYDNTTATSGSNDPTTGFECFGEPNGGSVTTPSLDNTLWFKIIGDGNEYYIQASSTDCSVGTGINNNDTQMAIYTGTCNTLTPLACNEDMENTSSGNYPAALQLSTVAGETYYILVDGFNFNGTRSEGEFCMFITQFEFIACNAPSVSGGTASATTSAVCEDQDVNITIEGALAPNEGALNGYAWVVSAMDLAGNPEFIANQNYIAGFEVTPTPTSPLIFTMSDYALFDTETTYYYTLVAFGNATWTNPDQQVYIGQTTLDADCITLSNSVQIDYCPVGILEADETVLGMTVFPNPAKDLINISINSNDYMAATIMISTIAGQAVKEEQMTLVSGVNTFSMDMSDAAAGIYIVSLSSNTHQSVTRFLKQ